MSSSHWTHQGCSLSEATSHGHVQRKPKGDILLNASSMNTSTFGNDVLGGVCGVLGGGVVYGRVCGVWEGVWCMGGGVVYGEGVWCMGGGVVYGEGCGVWGGVWCMGRGMWCMGRRCGCIVAHLNVQGQGNRGSQRGKIESNVNEEIVCNRT